MTDNFELPSALHRIGVECGPWAMSSSHVEALVSSGEIAFDRLRSAVGKDAHPTLLEAYRASRAANSKRMGQRGDVGLVYVEGPLLKYESWITGLLGLTTYESLRQDFQSAMDDPDIKAILLKVDTPGGEASGCDEVARAIFEARGKKPITAYVSGMACSAGYWIASAADRIIASDGAIVGSIGVAMTVADYSKRDKERGIRRTDFVSSQSPNKKPDGETDAGSARLQKMVDDMADVFVSAVAKYRSVTKDTVINRFGKGGVEIGAKAVKAGLADEVGQFEAVLSRLQARTAKPAKTSVHMPATPANASYASISSVATQPSAEEIARAAAVAHAQRQARALEEERQAAATEAARKAQIAANWKRAADDANAGIGPNAVKSAI